MRSAGDMEACLENIWGLQMCPNPAAATSGVGGGAGRDERQIRTQARARESVEKRPDRRIL